MLAGLLPLLWLFIQAITNHLGSNPIEALHIRLGDWTLRFLWLTLAVTPLQIVSQWRGMADFRQLLGLYTWFYGTLHILVYIAIDHAFEWSVIIDDILESSYIWYGVVTYLILLLLALTSSNMAKKRMGKNWKKLHRWIYLAPLTGLIHFIGQLKGNLAEPLLYTLLVLLLFGFRIANRVKQSYLARLMVPVGRVKNED